MSAAWKRGGTRVEKADAETIARWHRWFAIECNNRSWDLAARPDRSTEEDRELLLGAHAAAYHWSKVGKPINDMRAELLLAHAHALLGHGDLALGYARRCLEFCETQECEDWDLAFAHSHMALAAAALGDPELHSKHYIRAEELGSAIRDEEDRKVFLQEFERVPAPA
jgi:hypothetical protein